MSTMNSNQAVYYGPSTTIYPTAGSVSSGESVTALWKEGTWCYIQYQVTGTSTYKRGYVPTSTITITETISTKSWTSVAMYTQTACSVFFGPSPSIHPVAGNLSCCETVLFLGFTEKSHSFVEYSVDGSSQKKRGWVYASYLGTSIPEYLTFKAGDAIPGGLPLAGAQVTQGWNDKSTNHKGHLGYDMVGFTDVTPLFDGVVVSTQETINKANGRTVCVQHTVNGATFFTSYCHLASISVSPNDNVSTGTKLGVMGGSGNGLENGYSVHLHVCVYTGDATNNPMGYCGDGYETFEDVTEYANEYYYGPDEDLFPNCYGRCYYDPYMVVTSNADVINQYP